MAVNLSKIHQTSCEGYVTKRGHFLNTAWKRRYMVLKGDTLLVSYYDSKDVHDAKGEAKGSFVLTECEKQDLSDEGGDVKPFGFLFVGHCPGHGYKEYSVYVESQIDQTKWLSVANNALGKTAMPRKSISEQIEAITGHKQSTGIMLSVDAQVKNMKKTSQEILHQAIQDAKKAEQMGDETVGELVYQEGVLSEAEATADAIAGQLDHAEEVGRKLKHPFLYSVTHLFSPKKKKTNAKGRQSQKNPNGSQQTPMNSPVKLQAPQQTAEVDQLDQLSAILAKLGTTADKIGEITDRTTEQVDRIDVKVTDIDNRVKKEEKNVQDILKREM
ncbi:Aste57867_12467 [Aphanomyces stellatus]|uniref:Aste57867_12467 protein n=1 Tax=Aphanomyces stellatus TaxID=120398 RepID=A0A485KWF1_9STRA|nr:hypothetical protein As57867_012421 [Aphanomyces stellatus]VFT89318.1 Aste57867_12467 [Aphanomyces stellatus]